MARIDRSTLTKLEIIQAASKLFLENGYTHTTVKKISDELDMSTGNLTFYYPTKEHLLAELVKLLCDFQWEEMKKEVKEGNSSIMAVCLELTAMAVICEEDEVIRDFYHSAYTSPMTLKIIQESDTKRAMTVFAEYRPDWEDKQFALAEILVSGIEYATLMSQVENTSLENRVYNAVGAILNIFEVPEEIIKQKIDKLSAMDCRKIAHGIMRDFRKYVEKTNERALIDLLKS